MDHKKNYSSQSMNEIVFEKRNKDYGAFLLRKYYQKNLLWALSISISVFVIGVSAPGIIRAMGLLKDNVPVVADTLELVLQAPPSLDPLEPPAPAIPEIEEVKPPDELELEAAKEEDITRPVVDTSAKKNTDPVKGPPNPGGGNPVDANKVYGLNNVQQIPQFMGGDEAYIRYMTEHQQYPEKEMEDGIEGVTQVYYVVNQEGFIESVKVVKSSGNANLDAEAVRLVKMQPRYRPGMMNGHPVKVGIAINITFKL